MPACLAGVFDAEGSSLIPGQPDLDQATLDTIMHKTLVAAGTENVDADGFVQTPLGRVWLLLPGAKLDHVPAAERQAARAVLRCGQQ